MKELFSLTPTPLPAGEGLLDNDFISPLPIGGGRRVRVEYQ